MDKEIEWEKCRICGKVEYPKFMSWVQECAMCQFMLDHGFTEDELKKGKIEDEDLGLG